MVFISPYSGFGFTASLVFFSLFKSLQAVPLLEKLQRLSPSARDLLKRSTPAAPHFVAYNEFYLTYTESNPLPSASDLQGFNVFAIAYLMSGEGPVGEAYNWAEASASQQASYLSEYKAAGISLIVSAFGSTDTPTSSGFDPTLTANYMAGWVSQYGLHGIDVAYQDFAAFDSEGGIAETWLITFTKQLRAKLPEGDYILSHAPAAQWFSPKMWSGGGYLAINSKIGSLIDWYNVAFYGEENTIYNGTTCSSLLQTSSSTWPETALFQIAANGVNLEKLVIYKPGYTDAASGYIAPSTLATCVAEAAKKGWHAGVAVFEYPEANSTWIKTVRGSTFPESN